MTPGSFTFTTGSGADTTHQQLRQRLRERPDQRRHQCCAEDVLRQADQPDQHQTGTLLMYNGDSGKYINGTVTVAPNGMSATFTPAVSAAAQYLLPPLSGGRQLRCGWITPTTGAYLNGINTYFTTGNGADLTAANRGVCLAGQQRHGCSVERADRGAIQLAGQPGYGEPASITVTPSGGSPIAGTATLASDLVTLTFVPTTTACARHCVHGAVNRLQDVVGNVGAAFSSYLHDRDLHCADQRLDGLQRRRAADHRQQHGRRQLELCSSGWPARIIRSDPTTCSPRGPMHGPAQPLRDCWAGRYRLVRRMGSQRTDFRLDRHQPEQRHGQHAWRLFHNLQYLRSLRA